MVDLPNKGAKIQVEVKIYRRAVYIRYYMIIESTKHVKTVTRRGQASLSPLSSFRATEILDGDTNFFSFPNRKKKLVFRSNYRNREFLNTKPPKLCENRLKWNVNESSSKITQFRYSNYNSLYLCVSFYRSINFCL